MPESMSEVRIESTPSAAPPPAAPACNAAVRRCVNAHAIALYEAREKKMDKYDATKTARRAYRAAMPDLSDQQSVRDFVACIAHGMLLEIIDTVEGPKLLYAAQVASGILRQQPRETKPSA